MQQEAIKHNIIQEIQTASVSVGEGEKHLFYCNETLNRDIFVEMLHICSFAVCIIIFCVIF